MGKCRNCIKKRWETSALNLNQELTKNTTEFNHKIQSSTQKGVVDKSNYKSKNRVVDTLS